MENLPIVIYLMEVIENLSEVLGISIILLMTSLPLSLFFGMMDAVDSGENKVWTFIKPKCKFVITYIAISALLLIALPSRSTMYAMLAATGLNQAYTALSESDTIAPIVDKSFKLIEKELDVRLSELSENKNTK